MADSRKRQSLLFRSGIQRLRQAGIDPDPEEVVEVYEASRRCLARDDDSVPPLLNLPVKVGPVTLWPRTIGAALWWKTYGEKWFAGKDTADELVALAWLLAHANDRKLLQSLTTRRAALRRIWSWQLGLPWGLTLEQLAWGVSRLFRNEDIDADTGREYEAASPIDWGEPIARLCAIYHRPPEYFLWDVGERAAADMLKNAPPPPGCHRAEDQGDQVFRGFDTVVRRIIERRRREAPAEG